MIRKKTLGFTIISGEKEGWVSNRLLMLLGGKVFYMELR